MPKRVNVRPDHLVEPHLPLHLLDLQLAGHSERSIRERRLSVLRAGRQLGRDVAGVSADELITWQRGLTHLKPSGLHNQLVHVRQYLRWCTQRGIRTEDPSAVLIRPRLRDRLPRPMGEVEIAEALAAADQPLRAWIALAAFCGLRCMEIAKLERDEIIDYVDVPYLRVTGKGGKTRVVPLPVTVLAELRTAGLPTTGNVFSRMDGRPGPPSPMRVSERVNAHLHSLGIAGTAHMMRHRFGTKLYAATRDLLLVAQVMGHTSTQTTMGYVQISPFAAAIGVEQISQLSVPID